MYTHETDLPTKQKEKGAQVRLSQADEDGRRQSADQASTQKGKKTSLCLKRRLFPKSARILKRSHFQKVSRNRAKWTGTFLVVVYRRGHAPCAKLGITVTKRFGKAHERNRFKRLVREAFRHLYPAIPSDLEMNILPQSKPETLSAIFSDLKQFLSTLK